MATKKCPVCDVAVKLENLERHVRNQHPRAAVEVDSLLTNEERKVTARSRPAALKLTRQGKQLIAILAVVVAAILILVIFNPFPNVPGIGETAPDFSVRTTTGSTIVLSSYRGTPVLLEFMDVDCPACGVEVPTLVALYANYSSSVRFLSIDVNFVGSADNDAKIGSWATSHGATWPYALDTTGGITRSYGVTATPTTFVLDADGIVRATLLPPNNSYSHFVSALSAAGA